MGNLNTLQDFVDFLNQFLLKEHMVFRLPRFDKIRDFCSFQKQLQSFSTKQHLGKLELLNTTETSDNDFKAINLSRSMKRQFKKPQTSFEKEFLHEHLEAFDFKIQNYLQQMLGGKVPGIKPLLRQDIFPKKSIGTCTSNQLQYYLSLDNCLLSQQRKQMFMEETRYEQKLQDFLNSVCAKSCDQVANEIIFLADEIREQFTMIRDDLQYSYQKLIQQSKNLVEFLYPNIKNHSHISYLTLQRTLKKPVLQNQQRDQETKKIIQFLILTIFLILSHQFTNPFYQQKIQSQLKRHTFFNNYTHQDSYQEFSDDEQSQGFDVALKGRKKIK